ncbi:hypothetical protein M8Z33_16975 [Streptomyces sp. ZAF1911]|uniref:hypothetical protein n=1 Tax=Streptomyces sp. ZAF1911 TaxID=2944129 RepID=UPI00237B2547|nr:hypothetical protein [Streptomyces sp. ZAF1911]MDD9378319.1 hypothetical protein [Streptomyces sp. ZAF1911]
MSQQFPSPAPDAGTPAPEAAAAPAPYPGPSGADFLQAQAPAPARPANVGLGIAAAVGAALVTGALYGTIIGLSGYQIGYAAIGVGAAVGFAAGKLGGSNPLLPVLSALLSLAAVFGGQLFGIAMYNADDLGVSTLDVLNLGTSLLVDAWKEDSGPMTYLFLAIGGYTAFQSARKAA